MEPIYQQTFLIDDSRVDCRGYLKPSQLLYFIQETSGAHSTALSVGYEDLLKRRLFWAVTRHRVQITRLPRSGETIRVETWPMPATRVAYPRSTVAYDENGNECFRSITLWVLMDLDTRNMILPGKSEILVPGTLRGGELTVPGALVPKTLAGEEKRRVCYTDLDRNGHMNNTRYMDWAADLLPSSFHRVHNLRELIICYHTEAREGQLLTLRYDAVPQDAVQIEGFEEAAPNHRVFTARLIYGD